MIKAVIFDMDGVLIDSEPLHARAALLALSKIGIEVPMEYCYTFIGSTTLHMFETMIQDFNLTLTSEELLTAYQVEKQSLLKTNGYNPIPFTKELIIDLYKNGVKLAIASSSTITEIEDVVNALGLTGYFDKLISGTTVVHPKPAPDVFIKAMNELGVISSECIVIEDSTNGVRAGEASGIPVIGFVNEHSGQQDLSKAFILIEGFEEIDYNFIENTYLHANNKPIVIATTNRLILRELTVDDIPTIYRIYQDSNVKTFIDDIDDSLDNEIEKHKAYIKNVYNFYNYGMWGAFKKDSDQLIGRCGLQNMDMNGQNEIEIGYLFDINHWGNGYATECSQAILSYAFQQLDLHRIVAVIDPMNIKSINVAKRIGMKKENDILRNGHIFCVYSIDH